MKEAILYKKLKKKRVKCLNCSHYCIIEDGKRGICGVRENKGGRLYSLVYGLICALNIDPIEKKPFYHFLPGSYSLSMATVGCNFSCHSCQNWDISQGPKIYGKIFGEKITPKQIVEIAKKENLPSISYTYTEPTIFSDFALSVMILAKKEKIKNNWVSNGFFSKELFEKISPFLDAINVDLKGFSENFYRKYCGGRLKPVLENLIRLKKAKIWTEITTLVIPTLNDDEKIFKGIANFIVQNLGKETPWHISQFSGAISWKLRHLPDTPYETLKKAYQIGKEKGLKYVYIGNIFNTEEENTYCPKCNTLCIQRIGYQIKRFDKDGKCPKCRKKLNLILK